MKEVPCRRENLHSIISKISGSVEVNPSQEGCTADNETSTQNDNANSTVNIADEQDKPMKSNMFAQEADKIQKDLFDVKDDPSQQGSPTLVARRTASFSCQLCHVGFLTQRELQLHAMCHGIYISKDVTELNLKKINCDVTEKPEDQGKDNNIVHNDKEINCRKSPLIQINEEPTESDQLSPMYKFTGDTTDKCGASSISRDRSQSQDSTSPTETESEHGYGKIVDVLSLATATRGFKEPGSIWCSLCKCTVDKGHSCEIHQPSYHAEKTEEGFTCELCGRYYNQKRKLRTHLRNRHKGFRLQEDEGYMCWQCWQAFPEIKILEEHIVTVHGQQGRRQNSTWRPFTTSSTLPFPGETIDDQETPMEDTTQNDSACFADRSETTSLKRPGDDLTNEYPAKRSPGEMVCNNVLNVGEVNGKVVVNDGFLMTTEDPTCPQSKSPNLSSPMVVSEPPVGELDDSTVQTNNPNASDKDTTVLPETAHVENASHNQAANLSAANNPTTNHSGNPLHSSNTKKKSFPPQKPIQCPHCSEVFYKKYILQMHIQQKHGENMHCFFCSTSCGTKEMLSLHIKDMHAEEVKSGKCPICQCKCLGELHQHIVQYHHKDLLMRKDKDHVLPTCPICHQTTTDAYHLRWHVLNEHGGMALPGEQQGGGSLVETSSESGSSVSSEAGLGSEKMAAVTKGTMGTPGGNVAGEEVARGDMDTDEIEIVFVSDKNVVSNCPLQHKVASCKPGPNPGDLAAPLEHLNVPGNLVQSVKKPADSSGNAGEGPKLDNKKLIAADNVDSTTGLEETKPATQEVSQGAARSEHTPCDYLRLSEQACIFCFKHFADKETLVSHLKSVHGWVDTFMCPICSFEGQNYLNIVEHFCVTHFHPIDNTLTQAEVKCLKCDIIFQDIAHLKKHSTALHSFQIPCLPRYNTFKCRHCNIIFDKKFDAQKHFDAYHLFRIRYKCETCRMGFTAKYDFQEHVTCNHPELVKSFCPVCGLGFEVTADLEEHVFEMHRRKAQFHCAKCRNEFTDRFHVHMHIRSNCCVQWADSNFECLDCLTAFSSISELRIHCNQKSCKPSGN